MNETLTAFSGAQSRPSGPLRGETRAPGDKSISHRALLFGALAEGETFVRGLLEGEDVLRTGAALRTLGVPVEREMQADGSRLWRIRGDVWGAPARALYFGNSGTGCRLMMGAVAGRGVAATFDGDASLRRRPMNRVLVPLAQMGLVSAAREGGLPAALTACKLVAVDYESPTASAQVKSAVLLAGLGAAGVTSVLEPAPSRDHTERLLRAFGANVSVVDEAAGRRVTIAGGQTLKGGAIEIPGDPSSAAFLVAAAAITPGSDILVRDVLVNPLRAGFYATLREMGADIVFENERVQSGEQIADVRVRHAPLRGVAVPASRAPSMIDEYPILAVVAAFADGDTYMPGVSELRVKESDRIAAVEAGLAANGVATESAADWLRVFGGGCPAGGGRVATQMDHRIAMSFLVMGLAARAPVEIDDAAMIATSFPSFFVAMRGLGASIDGG